MENEVSTQPRLRISPQEYLERERKAEIKCEYLDGEMFAMSGVTREHAIIVMNLATELNIQGSLVRSLFFRSAGQSIRYGPLHVP